MLASRPIDLIGGRPLPLCPNFVGNHTLPSAPLYHSMRTESLVEPEVSAAKWSTAAFLFFLEAALAFMFALYIAFRYQSIRIFGRRLRSDYISNHLWIYFMSTLGISAMMDGTRYLLEMPYHTHERLKNMDAALLLVSTVLKGLSLLFLALALRWEKTYRTGVVPLFSKRDRRKRRNDRLRLYFDDQDLHDDEEDEEEIDSVTQSLLSPAIDAEQGGRLPSSASVATMSADPIRPRNLLLDQHLTTRRRNRQGEETAYSGIERLSIFLFLMSLATLYLDITPLPHHDILYFVYLLSFCLLYVPILIMSVLVIWSPSAPSAYSTSRIIRLSSIRQVMTPEGPTLTAKVYLGAAFVFGLLWSLMPPSMALSLLLPDSPIYLPYPATDEEQSQLLLNSALFENCLPTAFWGATSLMDWLHFAHIISLVFWFMFVRLEFSRVKERCIVETVSRVRDTFGLAPAISEEDEQQNDP